MAGISKDMQKLSDAVACLVGDGTVQERLHAAMIPLSALKKSGMVSHEYRPKLTRIMDALGNKRALTLSDSEAVSYATAIHKLSLSVFYDAVWNRVPNN